MNLATTTTAFAKTEDHSWLRSAAGTHFPVSVTLDASTFSSTPFPGLLVKSGTLLGKITASGLYGPYDSSASDGRQTPVCFLFGTTDLTDNNRAPSGVNSPAPVIFTGVIAAAKVPQGTGSSATTPGAIDTATGPALTTLTGSAPYTLPAALIKFVSRFIFL